MDKKHLKITLISILITSTLFNSANDHIADANEDIDENYQVENDIDDGADAPLDEGEEAAESLNEAGTAPEAEYPEEPVDDAPAEASRISEDEAILQPADGAEEEIEAFETIEEETLPVEVEGPEEPVIEESGTEEPVMEDPAEEAPADEDSVIEEPEAEEPAFEEPEDITHGEGNEADEFHGGGDEEIIGDGGNVDNGEPEFNDAQENPIESGQPVQDGNFTDDDEPSQPVEEEQSETLESYEYHYEEPSAEQLEDAGSWNTEEYEAAEAEEALYENHPGTAGKKLHRYDHGDILSGISFSPGESDESLELLDKRVNRIMTSKILEEDEVSEEDVLELEEEIKNEAGITSSDRDVLPNTGEASNYNYLYSIMLIAAGTILFLMTKRPRQE